MLKKIHSFFIFIILSCSMITQSFAVVPENYTGEVNVTTVLKEDGTIDILGGLPATSGGPFDRAYNGVSGSALEVDPLTPVEYSLSYLNLASQIWGITEIGEKMCKPTGREFPKSLVNWWVVLKNYVEAEKKRDSLFKGRVAELEARVSRMISSKNSELQLESIKTQIESLNISIDSISGSSLYSGDNKASEVRSTSRIAWRETILAAIYKGLEESKQEDAKAVEAYTTCTQNVETSLSIATAACTKSTTECARTKTVCSKDACSVVPDPVPGSCELKVVSCEMQNTDIPLFKKIALKDLAELYYVNPIPSKEMNERLLKILAFMKKQVNVFFPKSTDSNYNWTTPLQACVDPIINAVKNNGVICPANAQKVNPTVNAQIVELYKSIGRDKDKIDAGGAAYWKGQLAAGKSLAECKAAAKAYVDSIDSKLKADGLPSTQELLNSRSEADQALYKKYAGTDHSLALASEDDLATPSLTSDQYDPTTFENYGRSDDMMAEMNHYVNGSLGDSTNVTQAHATNIYKEAISKMSKSDSASPDSIGSRAVWLEFSTSQYAKNYLAGRPIAEGIPTKDISDFIAHILERNKLPSHSACTPESCPVVSTVESLAKVSLPPVNKISESAKEFLTAMGISNESNSDNVKFLNDKWNAIDLYFGQSNIRQLYFNQNLKIIQELILSDRAKLGALLLQRKQIIDYYSAYKTALEKIAAQKTENDNKKVSPIVTKPILDQISTYAETTKNQIKINPQFAASIASAASGLLTPVSNASSSENANAINTMGIINNVSGYSAGEDRNSGAIFSMAQGSSIKNSIANIKKQQDNYKRLVKMSENLKPADSDAEQKAEELLSSTIPESFVTGARESLLSSLGSGGGMAGSGGGIGSTNPQNTQQDLEKSRTESRSSGQSSYGSNYGYSGGYEGSSGSSSRSGRSSGSSKSHESSKRNNGTTRSIASSNSDDEKSLMDAISARDKESMQRYQSKESDSLFDQITKAHIRNYQRLQR